MSWNYRVRLRTLESKSGKVTNFYDIIEAYYDEAGNINGWSENSMEPIGETVEELRDDMNKMIEALNKPILNIEYTGKENG